MEKLDILYMCNDGFAEIAGVSMTSLFEQNPKDSIELTVYLLGVELSDKNIQRFHALEQLYGQKIVVIDANKEYEATRQMNLNGYRGSVITNLRLRFDLMIPETVHRILYIDCDTIICDSLHELATFSLQGNLLGMVFDAYGKLLKSDPDRAYYNAGVLLIDCDKWRQESWREKIETYIENNSQILSHPDQDIFNILCKDTITLLPMRYNFQVVHREYSEKLYFKHLAQKEYYSKQEIEEARKKPAIIHLIRVLGTNPWCTDGKIHPDYQLYALYKEKSDWKTEQTREIKLGGVIQCERALKGILPEKIFLPLKIFAMRIALKQRQKLAK